MRNHVFEAVCRCFIRAFVDMAVHVQDRLHRAVAIPFYGPHVL